MTSPTPKEIEIYYGKVKVTKNDYCPKCKKVTPFAIHGIDKDGKLWKGHMCECNCWQCLECGFVFKPSKKGYSWECCR